MDRGHSGRLHAEGSTSRALVSALALPPARFTSPAAFLRNPRGEEDQRGGTGSATDEAMGEPQPTGTPSDVTQEGPVEEPSDQAPSEGAERIQGHPSEGPQEIPAVPLLLRQLVHAIGRLCVTEATGQVQSVVGGGVVSYPLLAPQARQGHQTADGIAEDSGAIPAAEDSATVPTAEDSAMTPAEENAATVAHQMQDHPSVAVGSDQATEDPAEPASGEGGQAADGTVPSCEVIVLRGIQRGIHARGRRRRPWGR